MVDSTTVRNTDDLRSVVEEYDVEDDLALTEDAAERLLSLWEDVGNGDEFPLLVVIPEFFDDAQLGGIDKNRTTYFTFAEPELNDGKPVDTGSAFLAKNTYAISSKYVFKGGDVTEPSDVVEQVDLSHTEHVDEAGKNWFAKDYCQIMELSR